MDDAALNLSAGEGADAAVFRAQGGSLYVVATPLGNLRDLTLRALDILRTADVVAAEDTRVSAVLLRHYRIETTLVALHAHNEARRGAELLAQLVAGRSVALISDAGTPGVSDPGARLVRMAHDAGRPVVPVPGPSAAIAAVSAAGLGAERFLFAGFLPSAAKARQAMLRSLAMLPCAVVLYEAPHRVQDTVADLAALFASERILVIARELTKRFETIARMPLQDAAAWIAADPNHSRGEFVLIVDAPLVAPTMALDGATERWLVALAVELSPAQAARIAAAATGLPRDVLYARVVALRGPDRP
ncbi:MAG: 16S rRNA (cytidine(1402)-2'-O)-methyltransferase [Casimicrobiaceae bacterium]